MGIYFDNPIVKQGFEFYKEILFRKAQKCIVSSQYNSTYKSLRSPEGSTIKNFTLKKKTEKEVKVKFDEIKPYSTPRNKTSQDLEFE